MSRHVNGISGRLSLRSPQRKSLEILDRVLEIAQPHKEPDLRAALQVIHAEYPSVTDFERAFPSLCFALATGVGKTRLMGAFIAYLHLEHGRDEVRPSELPKPLVQALGNVGRLPNGNYSAAKLQEFIDILPPTRYNWGEKVWNGQQRHSNEPSKVFQLNATNAHIDQLKAAGLLPMFKKLHEKFSQNHPTGPAGIGWVRWTGDGTGIHIDEVQSDYANSLVKRVKSQVARMVASGKMQPDQAERVVKSYEDNFPDDKMAALQKILYGGRHASEVLHDAFHAYLRLPIHQGQAGPTSLIGAPVHIWTPESKAAISMEDVDGDIPAHMLYGYGQLPKKSGYEPSTYGSIPTQSNVDHLNQDIPPVPGLTGEPVPGSGKLVPAKPTLAEEVRKHEELMKADPRVWSAGDFKVPHKDHPSRKQFDQNFRKKLEEFFITPNFDQFVERSVPIEKLIGGHDVPSSNNPAKTKLYTRMYASGDPGLPMVVSPGTNGHYHIVDGNRRLLAAQAAGVKHLKVLSKERIGGRVRKSEPLMKAEPKLPPNVQKSFDLVRAHLSDDLRKPEYRGATNRYTGHCYVCAEALHHLLGGSEAGWVPQFIRWENAPHWYLKHPATGTILDPTAEQFNQPVPYDQGSGKGFLTKEPSKRAQELLDRVKGNL